MAKKEGGYMGFDKLTESLKEKGHDEDSAKALAAWIGRKKYGASQMAQMAQAGKKG